MLYLTRVASDRYKPGLVASHAKNDDVCQAVTVDIDEIYKFNEFGILIAE